MLADKVSEPPVIVSIHSFTPVWRGVPRPWHAGVLWDREGRLGQALIAALQAEGDLIVGDNEPYDGALRGDTMYSHAIVNGFAHALLEIRQDLIADEGGQREWAERLTRVFTHALEEIGQLGMIVDTNAG